MNLIQYALLAAPAAVTGFLGASHWASVPDPMSRVAFIKDSSVFLPFGNSADIEKNSKTEVDKLDKGEIKAPNEGGAIAKLKQAPVTLGNLKALLDTIKNDYEKQNQIASLGEWKSKADTFLTELKSVTNPEPDPIKEELNTLKSSIGQAKDDKEKKGLAEAGVTPIKQLITTNREKLDALPGKLTNLQQSNKRLLPNHTLPIDVSPVESATLPLRKNVPEPLR